MTVGEKDADNALSPSVSMCVHGPFDHHPTAATRLQCVCVCVSECVHVSLSVCMSVVYVCISVSSLCVCVCVCTRNYA